MCVAIPSKVIEIDDNNFATIDVLGVHRKVSLMLMTDVRIGDYVMVHAGFVINKIDREAALESLALIKEAVEIAEREEQNLSNLDYPAN